MFKNLNRSRKKLIAKPLPVVEAIDVKKTYMLGKIPVEALRGVNLKVETETSFPSSDHQAAVNQRC
jgi:hypothetical protein